MSRFEIYRRIFLCLIRNISLVENVMFSVYFHVGCYKITTVFSHAQTVVLCVGCSTVLCQPTGGKARLTEGVYLFTA